jgi:hypothetical protein
MVTIMTKQEKIERFRKMNETIEKGINTSQSTGFFH